MSDAELRPLPPEKRNGAPRWEVVRDGQRLGIIVMKKLRGARNPFYEAVVPHPRTGKPMSLELHTELAERVAAIARFADDPDKFRQHWQ